MLTQENIKNIYPLSPMQEGMLFHSLTDGPPVYFQQLRYRINGNFDWRLLEKALNFLIKRHDVLRTVFNYTKTRPIQIVLKSRSSKINYRDFRGLPEPQVERQVTEFIEEDRQAYFELNKDILIRISVLQLRDDKYEVIWSWHHIILDGWSLRILLDECIKVYKGYVNDKVPTMPEPAPFADYIKWLEKKQNDKGAALWQSYLEPFAELAQVPKKPLSQRHDLDDATPREICITFKQQFHDDVKSLAAKLRVTVNTIVQCIWAVILSKYSDLDNIVFGTVVSGRPSVLQGSENTVGLFINTIPHVFQLGKSTTFWDLAKRCHEGILYSEQMHFHPLAEILKCIKHEILFDHLLVFQKFRSTDIELHQALYDHPDTTYSIEEISAFEKTSYDLVLMFREGKGFVLTISYNTSIYSDAVISNISRHFERVIEQVCADPLKRTRDIDLITPREFWGTMPGLDKSRHRFSENETIVSHFDRIVSDFPDRIAVSSSNTVLTYSALNVNAEKFAGLIFERYAPAKGSLIAFLMDRCIESIICILGILKSGNAYLPIDPTYPRERIQIILDDARPAVLVTQSFFSDRIGKSVGVKTLLFDVEWPSVLKASRYHHNDIAPSDLAYVIYTSGSQGTPKGVMIEHTNVVRLFFAEGFQFDFNENQVWTLFHSLCFDFSVWEIFGSMLFGSKLILLHADTVHDPSILYRTLIKECVTVLNQVPPVFDVLIDVIQATPHNYQLRLNYVIFGGDALNVAVLETFMQLFPKTRLINMYGITETTVHVTFKEIFGSDLLTGLSNIGQPIPTLKVILVDRYFNPVSLGVIGQILVAGGGLARGYLNRVELTHERFAIIPRLNNEKVYTSGDLGFVNEEGDLIYVGRSDRQVKIRGFRIELDEIQAEISRFPNVTNCIVVVNNEPAIVAYVVTEGNILDVDLNAFLSRRLPNYMIPAYIVPMEQFPLTPNGKISYQDLPSPDRKLDSVPEDNDDDKLSPQHDLKKIWTKVLQVSDIKSTDNFFAIGGDSIKAIRLVNEMNKNWTADLRVKDLFLNPDIRSIAALVEGRTRYSLKLVDWEAGNIEINAFKGNIISTYKDMIPSEWEDIFPISDIQQGMLIQTKLFPESGMYHDQLYCQFEDADFDFDLFQKAVGMLVKKHAILRTSFHFGPFENPFQMVHRELESHVSYFDLSSKDVSEKKTYLNNFMANDRNNPFECSIAGLWRIIVFGLTRREIGLLFVCHHAIIDGWSNALFLTELSNVYFGQKKGLTSIGSLKASYRDFILQQTIHQKDQSSIDYWRNELDGFTRTPLPFHKATPFTQDQNSSLERHILWMEEPLAQKLLKYQADRALDVKSILLTAYLFLMKLTTGAEELVVGVVSNNRPEIEDGDKILGCFLNTIPFRFRLDSFSSIQKDVNRVHDKLMKLKGMDTLSLLQITELLKAHDGVSSPFFDVVFNYIDFHILEERNRETTMTESLVGDFDKTNTLFDFDLTRWGKAFSINVKARSGIFTKQELARVTRYYHEILDQIVADYSSLSVGEVIDSVEKEKVTALSSGKIALVPFRTVLNAIDNHCNKYAYSVAVQSDDNFVTYDVLNNRVHILARRLLETGNLRKHHCIGVLMPRSHYFVETVLAIWRCDCIYLPIDISLPINRIHVMLEDANPALLIVDPAAFPLDLQRCIRGRKVVFWDDSVQPSGDVVINDEFSSADESAYVLFTSGSTGAPKASMVTHAGMMNHIFSKINDLKLSQTTVIAQTASLAFDVSIWQLFLPLVVGGKIIIYPTHVLADPLGYLQKVRRECVTIIQLVPSYLSNLLSELRRFPKIALPSLEYLIVSAEALKQNEIKGWYDLYPDIKLVNGYGPTEASDNVTHYLVPRDFTNKNVPIGQPVQNMKVYILDNNEQLCPIGVKGEICISGIGVGLGYLNQPDTTASVFKADPWSLNSSVRMYKTGDIGCYGDDGMIYFFGRKDYQIKIQGKRVELGEIESCLRGLESVKNAIVVDKRDQNGDSYLIAYLTTTESIDSQHVREFLSANLPHYMVPRHIVFLKDFPTTNTGKINRKTLPLPDTESIRRYDAPNDEVEEKLCEIWGDIFEGRRIGTVDNFFELGGHSLKANQLVFKIKEKFQLDFKLVEVFLKPTIKEQADLLRVHSKPVEIIPKAFPAFSYELSHAQKQIWFINQTANARLAYLMFNATRIDGDLNVNALTLAFQQLIGRHESLRTFFVIESGEVRQKIQDMRDFPFTIEHIDLSDVDITKADAKLNEITSIESSSPIDLHVPPLLRVKLVTLNTSSHVIILTIHHILIDGWSTEVLIRELGVLYRANATGVPHSLEPLPIQYKDFAIWYNNKIKEDKFCGDYWLTRLQGKLPVLNIPTDYPRKDTKEFSGDIIKFFLGKGLTSKLRRFGLERKVTIFATLISAWNVILKKITNQNDIIIGVVDAGRHYPELRDQIGFYINTWPLRIQFPEKATFLDTLEQTKSRMLEATEYCFFPIDKLVETLNISTIKGRAPLFDIAVSYIDTYSKTGKDISFVKDVSLRETAVRQFQYSKYDIILNMSMVDSELFIEVTYDTSLFRKSTIEYFCKLLETVIGTVVENPDVDLDILVLTEEQYPAMAADSITRDFDFNF